MGEKEIHARVNFKLEELLTGIKNRVNNNWGKAFQSGNPKYSNYFEAFEELRNMFFKEMDMLTPYNHMSEKKKKEKRNEAVNKMSETLLKKGERDYHYKQRIINSIIEEAQNY